MIWRGEQGLKSQIWYLKEERERERERGDEKRRKRESIKDQFNIKLDELTILNT